MLHERSCARGSTVALFAVVAHWTRPTVREQRKGVRVWDVVTPGTDTSREHSEEPRKPGRGGVHHVLLLP